MYVDPPLLTLVIVFLKKTPDTCLYDIMLIEIPTRSIERFDNINQWPKYLATMPRGDIIQKQYFGEYIHGQTF